MDQQIKLIYEKMKVVLSGNIKNEEAIRDFITFCFAKYSISRLKTGQTVTPEVYQFNAAIKIELANIIKYLSDEKLSGLDPETYEELSQFFKSVS